MLKEEIHKTSELPPDVLSNSSAVIRWLAAKVLALTRDPRPWPTSPTRESGWYVYTGEGRGVVAGNAQIEGIDVKGLLRSPKFQAAFQAVSEVDRDPKIANESRSKAIASRYLELMGEASALPEHPASDSTGVVPPLPHSEPPSPTNDRT